MAVKETASIYYKSPLNHSEKVNSIINLHQGDSGISRTELKAKNAEIDQLRHQIVELSAILWQAEQYINELLRCVERLAATEDLVVRNNISRIAKQLQKLSITNNQDDQVVVNQDFIKKLQVRFPALSSNDLRICSLLRLNFSTKEIARKLGISSESANKARYRIRKKLALRREQDLVGYLIEF